MKNFLRVLSLGVVLLFSASAFAGTAILDWTANTEADLAGYKVYQSTTSGVYGTPVATLGKVITYTANLPIIETARTYFWTITAYDIAGNESLKSVQVTKTIPGVDLVPSAPVGITVR
jgi:hypothetical protein